MKKFLKEGEVAEQYGLNVRWLQYDRRTKQLLPFVKINRQVFYNADTIGQAIEDVFTVGGNRQPGIKVPKTVRKVATVKRGSE